ncbi:MAG: LPS export ABC transporter permease LptG [Alphaproteobacteria bacterium]|nr:LPS export ABC transporter permease LptG [Alphaproteobacteria bacterium]
MGRLRSMQIAKTLSSYIARQFFAWFCGVFMAMVIVTFLLDYIELIRRSATRTQATLWVLLEMAALKLPHTAQEVLPFAILFGTMLAFWRLTRNHELVIARAAGVSVWQFLTPAVLVALLVGIFAVTVFNPAASLMEAAYEKLESRILRQSSDQLSLSDAGLWLRQSDQAGNQVIIHAEKLAPGNLILDAVTLFFFNDQMRFTSRIDAQTAKLTTNDWVIENGTRWLQNEPAEPFTELRLPTTLTPRKIEESFASPDTMSFWDLPGFITLLEQSGFPAQRHRLHLNVLLARPFLLCAMVLVAATFSLRLQRRGGATLMIVGGVVSGFLLYFLSDVVFAFGLSAKVPVTLAAWTPTGVSLIFGASMLLHLEDG